MIDLVEDDYNDVDTYGARAALKIDLNDNWTITPQIMGAEAEGHGSFAEERGLGDSGNHAVQSRKSSTTNGGRRR